MALLEKANAYSALIGSVAGALTTLAVGAFFVGGQWERWAEIREAHINGKVINQSVDLTDYARTGDVPQLPDYSIFVRSENLPDFSQFATVRELRNIGNGPTVQPNSGGAISALCQEGFTMVGVRFTVATGDNAGALYNGLYPVCRKLVR